MGFWLCTELSSSSLWGSCWGLFVWEVFGFALINIKHYCLVATERFDICELSCPLHFFFLLAINLLEIGQLWIFDFCFFRKYLMEIYICYKIPFRKYLLNFSEALHTCDVMFYGLAVVVMRKLFNTLGVMLHGHSWI